MPDGKSCAEMPKRPLVLLMILLAAASAAYAQSGGGGRGGRGGGGGGHGRGGGQPPGDRRAGPHAASPAKPFSEPDIVGVVKKVDVETGRITIAYEPVEALSWPAGTQPFAVSKSALLNGLAVGEKVRFRLESQQIAAIRPF